MHLRWSSLVALMAVASPAAAQGQSGSYWLITQATGRWEYRVGTGQPRRLTGSYDYLVPAGQVRCLEPEVRRCELQYLSSQTAKTTRKLPVPLEPGGGWVNLRSLTPPPPPVLPATSQDLAAKMGRFTRPGGSRATSGCEGELPLEAPACGENVNASDFRIRWTPSPGAAGKRLLLIVERADDRSRMFREALVESNGEFASEGLNTFLRDVQRRTDPTDIVVRVDGGNRSAVRLVHLPPGVQTEDHKALIDQISSPDPVVRAVSVMSLALDRDMWSAAAFEARRLIELGGGSPSLMEYALVGVCQSDFEAEKGRLRKFFPEATYHRVCSAASAVPAGAPGPSAPSDAAGVASLPKSRLGTALLIGNWEYSSAPLNSVRNDLDGMTAALKRLGFDVVVASNLRGSQDFGRALNEALKQQPVGVDDALFVYYSGHGVQLDGRDFLLGTGAPAAARVADEVRPFAQSAEDFVYEMERALAGTRVLVIDACRNSVFSAARSVGGPAPKGGFALRQDAPNTFVMFANRPGLPTPARSDWGLMGPFTESLTQALNSNSSGDVLELYDRAAKMTRELSPSQDPVLYHTKHIERLVLKPKEPVLPDTRARELLNEARALYARREWTRFQAAVGRGKLIASAAVLKERLSREAEFAALALAAEAAQQSDGRDWGRAAENWEKASRLFPARQWVTMNAALAALYADDIERAARVLAVLSAQSDSDQARQAQKMLAELLKAFPELGPQATKAAAATAKVSGEEFEIVK